MGGKWKLVWVFAVLIGIFGLFGLYFFIFERERPEKEAEYGEKAGKVAPDFELPTLESNSVKLSDYRGRVIFLNIWATWCPPCREEMPSMEAIYRRFKGRQFEMLAVSVDRKGKEAVGPFLAKYGPTFTVLLDPDGKTYQLYGLTGVPETFIVNKKGVLLQRIIGPQDWMKKEWLDYFDHIIEQR